MKRWHECKNVHKDRNTMPTEADLFNHAAQIDVWNSAGLFIQQQRSAEQLHVHIINLGSVPLKLKTEDRMCMKLQVSLA